MGQVSLWCHNFSYRTTNESNQIFIIIWETLSVQQKFHSTVITVELRLQKYLSNSSRLTTHKHMMPIYSCDFPNANIFAVMSAPTDAEIHKLIMVSLRICTWQYFRKRKSTVCPSRWVFNIDSPRDPIVVTDLMCFPILRCLRPCNVNRAQSASII